MEIGIAKLIIAAGIIFLVIFLWVLIQWRFNPTWGTLDQPDAVALAKGSCGDSMKISLLFKDGKVDRATYWTDGCRMSNACAAAATQLALNKTPEEIADIDYKAVIENVGGLPEEDVHCATLAAGTLQEALKTYLVRDDNSLYA